MPRSLTLMTVHAHPDDETIGTGGVMARYAAEGQRVICVTCTNGEMGEIVVPELDTPENHERLADLRRGELARALSRLGPIEQHWLGYRDSDMMGRAGNDDPRCFWQADLDEATGRLVRLVRETRPDVLVGYNEFGGYGHPDHIRSGQVARLAFERAADPNAYPEQLRDGLDPWRAGKLYETVIDLARRVEIQKLLEERGVRSWWEGGEDETEEERLAREELLERMTQARGPLTTRVDVVPWLEAKYAALQEHVTQIAPDSPFMALTPEDSRQIQPTEDFTLRVSHVGVHIPEDDLFAGLRE
ncbi:MAG: PIG-L family deacetylase [Chloroflexi bacterium]|nr:PIG-L family deacetylase [Chloroflexota bacterium]